MRVSVSEGVSERQQERKPERGPPAAKDGGLNGLPHTGAARQLGKFQVHAAKVLSDLVALRLTRGQDGLPLNSFKNLFGDPEVTQIGFTWIQNLAAL